MYTYVLFNHMHNLPPQPSEPQITYIWTNYWHTWLLASTNHHAKLDEYPQHPAVGSTTGFARLVLPVCRLWRCCFSSSASRPLHITFFHQPFHLLYMITRPLGSAYTVVTSHFIARYFGGRLDHGQQSHGIEWIINPWPMNAVSMDKCGCKAQWLVGEV